jgi:hypothetical protein
MHPGLLHVVTVIANPVRWKSRLALYDRFEQHMLQSGVRLTTVECAFGDEDHALAVRPGVEHVKVWAKSHVWLKESLINLGLSRLPRDWRYVAWIDADITFRRADWAAATLHALQHFDLIQPWEHCYDLGPSGEHMALHCSFGRQWIRDPVTTGKLGKGYTFAHPGYAWAATRTAIEHLGGLIDHAVCGAADHHMALALVGKAAVSLPGHIHANYAKPVLGWQERAARHICGNVGYIPGTIEHGWHGSKDARRYIDRWSILTRHSFDPDRDIKRNAAGVIELAGNKPELKRDLWRYFQQRNEDANTL